MRALLVVFSLQEALASPVGMAAINSRANPWDRVKVPVGAENPLYNAKQWNPPPLNPQYKAAHTLPNGKMWDPPSFQK